MDPRHTFRLGFITDTNQRAFISVPHADITVTDTDVRDAMLRLIAADIISHPNGKLQTPDSACIVTVQTNEYAMT